MHMSLVLVQCVCSTVMYVAWPNAHTGSNHKAFFLFVFISTLQYMSIPPLSLYSVITSKNDNVVFPIVHNRTLVVTYRQWQFINNTYLLLGIILYTIRRARKDTVRVFQKTLSRSLIKRDRTRDSHRTVWETNSLGGGTGRTREIGERERCKVRTVQLEYHQHHFSVHTAYSIERWQFSHYVPHVKLHNVHE